MTYSYLDKICLSQSFFLFLILLYLFNYVYFAWPYLTLFFLTDLNFLLPPSFLLLGCLFFFLLFCCSDTSAYIGTCLLYPKGFAHHADKSLRTVWFHTSQASYYVSLFCTRCCYVHDLEIDVCDSIVGLILTTILWI